jgi:Spy/CpxP family protein refolding chaperone
MDQTEVINRRLAEKYARQHHRRVEERAAMMARVYANLTPEQATLCISLLRDAIARTTNDAHKVEAMAYLAQLESRTG